MTNFFTFPIRHLRPCVVAWIATASFWPSPARLAAETPSESQDQAIEFFEKRIRPLLVKNCYECHGPKTQWAGLRLDSHAKILEGGESGPAIVAGKAELSELISRVSSDDPDIQMPPPGEGEPLTPAEIEALTQWIDQGAAWPASSDPASDTARAAQDHWAFQPIENPTPPAVQNEAWVRQPIDRFILRGLESQGLAPSAPADRRTLIRRATYDLTGLPPSPEEVEAFANDPSEDAYPRLIQRLLDSPAYGEQWGRHWLDVARYSDTKGYVYGREERFFVHSAIYRDWVVKAFNEDLPYDRFLLLQLAADQAAPEDPTAAAAMGYITLGRRFLGVLPDIIDDRIDVVTRGTMGLTVSCARCHDHKFDPIPTADYYSLYGVFQNSAEVTRPLTRSGDTEAPSEKSPFEIELAKRKKALADGIAAQRAEFSELARKRIDEYLAAQWELEKYPEQSFSQILAKADVLPSTVRRWQKYLEQAGKRGDPVFTPWTALAGLPSEQFAENAPAALAAVDLSTTATNPQVAAAFATLPSSVDDLVQRYTKIFREVDTRWQALVAEAQANELPLPTQLPDPTDEQLRQVLYGLDSPCVIPDLPVVNIEFDVDTGTCVALWQLQSAVDQWILQDPTAVPHAVILEDKATITPPKIFRRGDPTNFGAEVPLRFLEILSGPNRQPFAQGSGRYEMAQAIVSPENPLTARVWVNRVWGHHFGEGLVRTPSDFGTRAESPSHPELLDWLAYQFMEGGWSTKSVHRQIMLSATYQQSSRGADDQPAHLAAAEADPENRLLWRMTPRRLTFEELRDTYLTVSGDLDRKAGGKGVDLFASSADGFRRTLYTVVDREFLPSVLRDFDFANPDLHTPQRTETTIPQQALFVLNHRFVADRARSLAA
ncbi:MAG: PSD1 and planctomycete cytochrome C domain-containing protein, partial [Pirellulaceae bacterium]